jgi:hypothetical protein
MTIWDRPHSNVPALKLGGLELRDLLSHELDKANVVLDEWEKDKQRGSSQCGASQWDATDAPSGRGAGECVYGR